MGWEPRSTWFWRQYFTLHFKLFMLSPVVMCLPLLIWKVSVSVTQVHKKVYNKSIQNPVASNNNCLSLEICRAPGLICADLSFSVVTILPKSPSSSWNQQASTGASIDGRHNVWANSIMQSLICTIQGLSEKRPTVVNITRTCVLCGLRIQNDQVEQWIYIKFCIKLEDSSIETVWMIQKAAIMGNWWLVASSWLHTHYASHLLQRFLVKHQITQVTQLPCSPDLAPCNFWLFTKLKSPLKGRRLQTMKEIQENRKEQLMTIPTKDFAECFEQWKRCWENCVRSQSAYLEGDWGVIVLYAIFLVSCIFFNKCLHFSYCVGG